MRKTIMTAIVAVLLASSAVPMAALARGGGGGGHGGGGHIGGLGGGFGGGIGHFGGGGLVAGGSTGMHLGAIGGMHAGIGQHAGDHVGDPSHRLGYGYGHHRMRPYGGWYGTGIDDGCGPNWWLNPSNDSACTDGGVTTE